MAIDDPTIFDSNREQVIPCDFTVKVKNQELDDKLSKESARSALLLRFIKGHAAYVTNGNHFDTPDCVKRAIEKNRGDNFFQQSFMKGGRIRPER